MAHADDKPVLRILTCGLILFYFYKCLGAASDEADDALLCRQCGHQIATAEHLMKQPSPQATHQRNDTILGVSGVLIQRFVNPHGRPFEVITSRKADIFKADEAVSSHTFFPGFSWRICVCPKCGFHLGWSFEPHTYRGGKEDSEETFVGLILDNLHHQDFADSLLVIPKSFRS